MINYEALKTLNSTNDRLREIFTATLPSEKEGKKMKPEVLAKREKDVERRKQWQDKIQARLEENVAFTMRNYNLYAAADMAWDSSPIRKQDVPLLQYAKGLIDLQAVSKSLESAGCGRYVNKDVKTGAAVSVDLPTFLQVECNLVRSVITRRLAAQSAKYANLWPHYKYEARGTSQVAKLRADVMSQVSDIIADQYGYKHHETQVQREAMLYGHSVDFVRCSWESEKQLLPKETVVKEGLAWVNPHPSRVFWDNAHPLASINTDSGCGYIGYWDVRRYGELADDDNLYNTQQIKYSQSFWTVYSTYPAYFNTYYSNIIRIPNPEVPPPTGAGGQGLNPTEDNARQSFVGIYSGRDRDQSVLVAEYYEKVVPQAHGFGDYPFPVWVRFLAAGDGTVIFAEFMPSTPAAVDSINENDSRLTNVSIAHEIMPYQDAVSNLITAMTLKIQQELLTFVAINKDVVTEPEDRKKIREILESGRYPGAPIVTEVSFTRSFEDNGLKPNAFLITRAMDNATSNTITDCIRGISQYIQLMERNLALSPHEQGQTASHEITAKETSVIESTTSTVYGFISDSHDEYRAAKKRILFESLVAKSKSRFVVPVMERYSSRVIQEAGYEVTEEGEAVNPLAPDERRQATVGVNAATLGQVHDFIFTTRDGAERPTDTAAANALVQLLATTINVPGVLDAIGKEKLYEIINEIWRLSGGDQDLGLEVMAGDEGGFGESATVEQLGQMVQQFAQQFQQFVQQQQQVNAVGEQAAAQLQELGAAVNTLATQVNDTVKQVKAIEQTSDQMQEKLKLELVKKYDKANPDIQRQIEAEAGYSPSEMLPIPTTETNT